MSDKLFERRRAERCYALKFLDYEVLSPGSDVIGRGLARTINVSETGLLIETGEFFEPGQRLRITLSLAEDLVQVEGQIMHSQPVDDEICSAGVMFLTFDEADRRTFQQHFETLKQAIEAQA